MRAKIFVASALLISICGCANSVSSLPTSIVQLADQRFLPGYEYEVETNGSTNGATISYLGKVDSVDDKFVVFDGAMKRVEITQSPRIPIVGKFFKNVGLGIETLNGKVHVSRDQITAIRDRSTVPDESISRTAG